MFSRTHRIIAALAILLVAGLKTVPPANAELSPFDKLAGRWVGEGRLGIKGENTEAVRCRVTYFVESGGNELRQNIRCASQSGSIEVASVVTHAAGKLSGTWKELTREWSGELSGTVHPTGFKVSIRGGDLSANMDIVVRDDRQVIEIQFFNSSLIGLTLILTKG
jgi:hypothetical protein